MIRDVLHKYRKKCRWYDVIAAEGRSLPISFKNNHIYSIVERENSGFGVRANIKNQTGFSFTNNPLKLDETFKRAISLAPYCDVEDFPLSSEEPAQSLEPYSEKIDEFNINREIAKGEEAIELIKTEFPDADIDIGISVSSGKRRLINSLGFDCEYRYSSYGVSISLIIVFDGGIRLNVGEVKRTLLPADHNDLIENIIWKTRNAVKIRKAESGKIPVIFTPRAFANLLGILASGLSLKSVYKGISPFAGKTGKKMFNECFTLWDDPLVPDSAYSYPFDDEGVPAKRKRVIGDGIIESFISDLKYAYKMKCTPSGNGSRAYSSLPAPSFSNIIINSGNTAFAEMLRGIKTGIMAEDFIGLGQSNTLTGQFSANLDLAYLIDNGEVAGRVKDCMISGNLFDLLSGDIILSKEIETHGSTILPYVLFPSVNFTV